MLIPKAQDPPMLLNLRGLKFIV